jgi:hypothetical protein
VVVPLLAMVRHALLVPYSATAATT